MMILNTDKSMTISSGQILICLYYLTWDQITESVYTLFFIQTDLCLQFVRMMILNTDKSMTISSGQILTSFKSRYENVKQ